MTESESVALPFGDTPISSFAAHKTILYTFPYKNQGENKKRFHFPGKCIIIYAVYANETQIRMMDL